MPGPSRKCRAHRCARLRAYIESGEYRVESLGFALVEIVEGSMTADASANLGRRRYLVRPFVQNVSAFYRTGLRFELRA